MLYCPGDQGNYLVRWGTFLYASVAAVTIDTIAAKGRRESKSVWPLDGFIWGSSIMALVSLGTDNFCPFYPVWLIEYWILYCAPFGCAGVFLAWFGRMTLMGNWKVICGWNFRKRAALAVTNFDVSIAPYVWPTIAVMACASAIFGCWWWAIKGFGCDELYWGPLTDDAYDRSMKATGWNGDELDLCFPSFRQWRHALCGCAVTWWCVAIAYVIRQILSPERSSLSKIMSVIALIMAAVWQWSFFHMWPGFQGFH